MKKSRLLLATMVLSSVMCFTAFAGQWKQDQTGWWYQNDDGSFKTGWYQDVDGKWYYLDLSSGYMLINATTPDGFKTNQNGEWVQENTEILPSFKNNYKLSIPFQSNSFNEYIIKKYNLYEIKVNILHDDEIIGLNGDTVKLESVEISKNNSLYLTFEILNNNGKSVTIPYYYSSKGMYIYEKSGEEYGDYYYSSGNKNGPSDYGILIKGESGDFVTIGLDAHLLDGQSNDSDMAAINEINIGLGLK